MPTYRDIERATGASRTLIRAIADEIDPNFEQRKKVGKSWTVTDHLAALISHEAVKRVRKPDPKDELGQPSALDLLEASHLREIESLKDAHEKELQADEMMMDSLRESISDRDKTIDGLRAELAAMRADNEEMRRTLAAITGASWYTRAFHLRRLLPIADRT